MINHFRKFAFIALLISAGKFTGFSQEGFDISTEKPLRNQIVLRHDNDFIMLSDRYYTSGLFLGFRRYLKKGIFKSGHEQLLFSLAQEVYTPSNTRTETIREMDRPYVGFHGVNMGWSFLKNKSGLNFNLLLGWAGDNSGAGSFQRWYHDNVVIAKAPVWVAEMETSFHANIYLGYIYEWQLAPNPFSVHFAVHPQAAFGTRDVYFHPEIGAYFGRRNSLFNSIAYNSLGSTEREIFFSIQTGYRFVKHNALLEGNLLGDDSLFLVSPTSKVFYGGVDVHHRFGKNDYIFGYRINAPETEYMKIHKYIILSYARSF